MAQPKLGDANITELLAVGPFLGIDAGDSSYFVDQFHATDSINVVPNRKFLGYLTTKGRASAFTGAFASATWGAAQFQRIGQSDLYIVATNSGGHGQLQVASLGGPPALISIPTPLSQSQETSFAEAQGWMFLTNNSDTPLKIDTNLAVTNWQMVPPLTAPTVGSFVGPDPSTLSLSVVAGSSDGNLVYIQVSFVDTAGNESSLFNSNSASIQPTTGQSVRVASPTVPTNLTGKIASYNVYATENLGNSFIQQNTSPVPIGTAFTLPTALISTGVNSPVWTGKLRGIYYYIVTYGTSAQESSGSPTSTPFFASYVSSDTPLASSGPILLSNVPISADPQVTKRNIYRFGGTLQEILLVGTLSDNTTTTFIDNTPDLSVTGQTLITHRDAPQPFYSIAWFKGRMWGFGYSGTAVGEPGPILGNSDLWYSNFQEPWGFNNVSQVFDVGRNIGGDIAVKVVPLGSILCLLKSQSFWAYYGGDNPTSEPPPFPLAPIGCASKKSVAVGYGRLGFVSSEGAIYLFDGQNFLNISDNRTVNSKSSIKSILDNFSSADFAASAGAMYDNMYLCSFPTQGLTFLYDIPSGQWFKLGWAADRFVYNLEEQNMIVGAEVGSGTFDSWFAAETDLGLSITSSYISRISDSGAPQATKRYRTVVVLAPVQVGATATVTTNVNPGTGQHTKTNTVDLSQLPIKHVLSMPPNMVGDEVQVTVSVTSNQKTEIHRLSVYGWIERQLVPKG